MSNRSRQWWAIAAIVAVVLASGLYRSFAPGGEQDTPPGLLGTFYPPDVSMDELSAAVRTEETLIRDDAPSLDYEKAMALGKRRVGMAAGRIPKEMPRPEMQAIGLAMYRAMLDELNQGDVAERLARVMVVDETDKVRVLIQAGPSWIPLKTTPDTER